MMSLHSYLLFVLAAVALILVPGPDVMYMLGRCLAQGRRAGILSAIGFNLGGYVHLTAAVLGLSAILATSATAFTAVKWIGAAYLVYLGLSALWSKQGPPAIETDATAGRRGRTILWQAFLSDVLNPKVALFFLALLPQFVDRNAPHPTLQIHSAGRDRERHRPAHQHRDRLLRSPDYPWLAPRRTGDPMAPTGSRCTVHHPRPAHRSRESLTHRVSLVAANGASIIVAGLEIPSREPLFLALVGIHVLLGLACTITGLIAMLSPKRPGRHLRFGSIYFWALAGVFVTMSALAAARWREDYDLFILGGLAFSAAYLGRRARRKRSRDWVKLHITGMGTSYVLLLTAFYVDNGKNLPLWRNLPQIAFWLIPAAIGVPLILRALWRHPLARTPPPTIRSG